MSDKKILSKINSTNTVEKKFDDTTITSSCNHRKEKILRKFLIKAKEKGHVWYIAEYEDKNEIKERINCMLGNLSLESIIFDINIAKNVWGEKPYNQYIGNCDCKPNWDKEQKNTATYICQHGCMWTNPNCGLRNWQYHLQQLVILSDNEKLKYLEKFLD